MTWARPTMIPLCGLLLSAALAAEPKAKVPAAPPTVVSTRIEYARLGTVSLTLDLHMPQNVRRPPLVMWIHGGGWQLGTKDRNPIAALLQFGYAIAAIDYRLSDIARFPAQVHDCKGAVRFLRANAAKYGYDAERIGVVGISAGGHLALMLATTGGEEELEGDVGGNLDRSSRVQAAVDMCGPSDFLLAQAENDWIAGPGSPLIWLLGGTVADKESLAKQASPAYHVTPDDAPLIILHGDRDPLVSYKQSIHMHELYRKAGLESAIEIIPGGYHVPEEFYDPPHIAAIAAFFDKHIRRTRQPAAAGRK